MPGQEVVDTAKNYYNSSDADKFYFSLWGGKDIHIGLYQSYEEPIVDASNRIVQRYIDEIKKLSPNCKRILDMGSGYGNTARVIAKSLNCPVDCLNLSDVQNARNEQETKKEGLEDLIKVISGNFQECPFPDNSYDVIYSQDSILHAPDKMKVFNEVHRLLRPGGIFIFNDPMQIDNCPEGVLSNVYKRIHLDSMGSAEKYKNFGEKAGLKYLSYDKMEKQLLTHYSRVRQELIKEEKRLLEDGVSQNYIDNMKAGLQHWIDAANGNFLDWGILSFKKE